MRREARSIINRSIATAKNSTDRDIVDLALIIHTHTPNQGRATSDGSGSDSEESSDEEGQCSIYTAHARRDRSQMIVEAQCAHGEGDRASGEDAIRELLTAIIRLGAAVDGGKVNIIFNPHNASKPPTPKPQAAPRSRERASVGTSQTTHHRLGT